MHKYDIITILTINPHIGENRKLVAGYTANIKPISK